MWAAGISDLSETMRVDMHFQLKEVSIDVIQARLDYLKWEAAKKLLAEFVNEWPYKHNFITREDKHIGYESWETAKLAILRKIPRSCATVPTMPTQNLAQDNNIFPANDICYSDIPMTIMCKASYLLQVLNNVLKLGFRAHKRECIIAVKEGVSCFKTETQPDHTHKNQGN